MAIESTSSGLLLEYHSNSFSRIKKNLIILLIICCLDLLFLKNNKNSSNIFILDFKARLITLQDQAVVLSRTLPTLDTFYKFHFSSSYWVHFLILFISSMWEANNHSTNQLVHSYCALRLSLLMFLVVFHYLWRQTNTFNETYCLCTGWVVDRLNGSSSMHRKITR